MDVTEKILYKKFIEAQYEYFKYIEPKRIETINKYIEGKVINPNHWRTQYIDLCSHNESAKEKDTKCYKELLVLFHPDKNPDNIQKATEYFQYIKKLINENNVDVLNDLLNSENKWIKMNEILEEDSVYSKAFYCNKIRNTRWFSWSDDDNKQFITQEELNTLLKEKRSELIKEKEELKECIKALEKHSELIKEKEKLKECIKVLEEQEEKCG